MFMEDFDLCRKVRNTPPLDRYNFADINHILSGDLCSVHYHKRLSEGSFSKLLFNSKSSPGIHRQRDQVSLEVEEGLENFVVQQFA